MWPACDLGPRVIHLISSMMDGPIFKFSDLFTHSGQVRCPPIRIFTAVIDRSELSTRRFPIHKVIGKCNALYMLKGQNIGAQASPENTKNQNLSTFQWSKPVFFPEMLKLLFSFHRNVYIRFQLICSPACKQSSINIRMNHE